MEILLLLVVIIVFVMAGGVKTLRQIIGTAQEGVTIMDREVRAYNSEHKTKVVARINKLDLNAEAIESAKAKLEALESLDI